MNDTVATEAVDTHGQDEGWEWAIVEIFGHRRHAGRCREEERFGSKMLRVDIPLKGDPATFGWTTHFYNGSSIFSFSLSDERSVMKANAPWTPAHRITFDEPQPDGDGEFEDGSGGDGASAAEG